MSPVWRAETEGHSRLTWRPGALLLGLMAFLIVVVQGSHPWLHPLELVEPSADPPLTCPVGHVKSLLLIGTFSTPLVPIVKVRFCQNSRHDGQAGDVNYSTLGYAVPINPIN